MTLDRRSFLAALAGAACSTPQGETVGQEVAENLHPFAPDALGANTAITGWGFFEAVAQIADLGYRTIEVQNLDGRLEATDGAFPGFRLDELNEEEKERIQDALKPFDQVTAHLPYPPEMNYIAPDGEEAAAALERALDAAAFVGAKAAVLHPQPSGADLMANWSVAVERIRRWGAMAADRGFNLACETSMPASVPDLLRFHDEIDHPNVGVTLDVGHQARFAELAHIPEADYATPEAIKAYNDLNIRIVHELGERLTHLHIHDIEPSTWAEHKPLIHGFIDYPALISALRDVRYEGALVFEIGGAPEEMPGYLREGKSKLDALLG